MVLKGATGDVYLTERGRTVIHDKQTNTETALDRDGRAREVSGGGGQWKFDYDKDGKVDRFSQTLHTRNGREDSGWQRTGDQTWESARGEKWQGTIEAKGDRVEFTHKDKDGKRVLTERSFATGRAATYHPESNPHHGYLEKTRDQLEKAGKLPPNTALADFHGLVHKSSQARIDYLNSQLAANRDQFNRIAATRSQTSILDSNASAYTKLGDEIIKDNARVESKIAARQKHFQRGA